jgi:fumarate hydratase class I
MIPNCAATRHAHFVLDGSGPAELEAPSLDAYPEIVWEAGPSARRVNLDTMTPEEVASWKPGETILLNGKMLTGRDAAHKRMVEMLNRAKSCRSTSKAASSTTSARSIRSVTKWLARPARPPPPGWTSSPARSSSRPACWA